MVRAEPSGGGLGYALMQAANAWRAELALALTPHALTPSQFFVLTSLLHAHTHGGEAPSQRELSERTGIDVNTLSQLVRALERRELIVRRRASGDARALELALTEAGLALARNAAAEGRALNRRFFAGIDPDALLGALTTLRQHSRRRRARSLQADPRPRG